MSLGDRAAPPHIAHHARLTAQKATKMTMRPRGNYDHAPFQFGVVDAINAGPPASVDVYLDGTTSGAGTQYLTKAIPYLASYAPTVGDVVLVRRGQGRSNSDRMVLGKRAGASSPYPLPLGTYDASTAQWGQSGNSIYGGSGAPTMPLANPPYIAGVSNGDLYLETDSSAVTTWKMIAGTWTPIANSVESTAQSGDPAYGLQLTDAGTVVRLTSSTSEGVNIPANASVPFPTGTIIWICQMGTAQATLGWDSGVTVVSPGGTVILHQYGTMQLRQQSPDYWVLSGDV